MSEITISKCDQITKEQRDGLKSITSEQHEALINQSILLLDFFVYTDDEDCKVHWDDFSNLIMDEIVDLMYNLKNKYYDLYTHRNHQRI